MQMRQTIANMLLIQSTYFLTFLDPLLLPSFPSFRLRVCGYLPVRSGMGSQVSDTNRWTLNSRTIFHGSPISGSYDFAGHLALHGQMSLLFE